jgi:monoamine oxidase
MTDAGVISLRTKEPTEVWDVVVIGGGVAGLAAAESIARAGCKTLLLEARDRLGGRILTVYDSQLSVPLELGAEFIHGSPKNLLELAHAARLTYHDGSDDHAFGLSRMEAPELVPLPHFWEDLALVMKKASDRGGRDRSFAQFLVSADRDPELRRFLPLVKSYVEGFHGADTRLISLKALAKAEGELSTPESRRVSRFTNGYYGVVDWLARGARRNGADIRLNAVVHQIKWSFDQVDLQISSRSGLPLPSIRARKAILTIPLSLLQDSIHKNFVEGAIRFEPSLEEKKEPARLLRMGAVMKVLLRFRSRFWEKPASSAILIHQNPDLLAFIHHASAPDISFPTWWTQLPLRAPLLTGWVGGPQALTLYNQTEEAVIDDAIQTLSLISGFSRPFLERELDGWNFHDWQKDPYARGSYSYVGVGGEDAQRELSRPLRDTLFFAGEAMHFGGQSGTVDGAIETGTLAARDVLRSLSGLSRGAQSV